MNVSLNPELEQWIDQKVKSGFYNSASEVVREGLRLLKEQDELHQLRLEELRCDLRKGLDSLDRGEGTPLDMDAIIARAEQRFAQGKPV